MPKEAIDYSKTTIYKVVCKDLDVVELYVGHTTNFVSREKGHKSCCKKSDFKVYQFIREHGGFENWLMLQVEIFPCLNRREAEVRERYWCETLKASLNSQLPTRTAKEYRDANADKIKEYRDANVDKLKEIHKEYYIANTDKLKAKMKEYRDANADKMKEYYIANADKLKAKMKEYRLKQKLLK